MPAGQVFIEVVNTVLRFLSGALAADSSAADQMHQSRSTLCPGALSRPDDHRTKQDIGLDQHLHTISGSFIQIAHFPMFLSVALSTPGQSTGAGITRSERRNREQGGERQTNKSLEAVWQTWRSCDTARKGEEKGRGKKQLYSE